MVVPLLFLWAAFHDDAATFDLAQRLFLSRGHFESQGYLGKWLEMPCGGEGDDGVFMTDFEMAWIEANPVIAKVDQNRIKNTGCIFFGSFHKKGVIMV